MAPIEREGSFDRKSQLADFNRKASAQIQWAKVAIRNVTTVKSSEMKTREQQVADLLEMGVEVSAWNTDQLLKINEKRGILLATWQQFAAQYHQCQVQEELDRELNYSHLSNRIQFVAIFAREKKLLADMREDILKKPPVDSGLSQLMLSQFDHERVKTIIYFKNRQQVLSSLGQALVKTRQWSAQDQEALEAFQKIANEFDDCALRQLHWIKVLYNNQAYFCRAKILLEKMTETLEGSITGRKGQREYCDDLSDDFKTFIHLWEMARLQLSRNVHWTPEKRQEMVDSTQQLRKTMEEMLAKLETVSCPQRKKCVSNFFKDLSSEKMAKTSRKEVLELLGKFFEVPAEYKEGNGPLLPWEDFALVCDTGFGKVQLGEKDPPKRTGDIWIDQFMADSHLALRDLIKERTWIEENRLELQRANDENNVETVKRLLYEAERKNAIIVKLKPLLILSSPKQSQRSVEYFVKNFVDDRWSALWQNLAMFKNMCIALLERLAEQGTMQA